MKKIFFAVLAVAIVVGCQSEEERRKAELLQKLTTPYTKEIPRIEPAGKPLEPIGLRPSPPSPPAQSK